MAMRPAGRAEAPLRQTTRWSSPLDAGRTVDLTDDRFYKILEARAARPGRQQDLRGEFLDGFGGVPFGNGRTQTASPAAEAAHIGRVLAEVRPCARHAGKRVKSGGVGFAIGKVRTRSQGQSVQSRVVRKRTARLRYFLNKTNGTQTVRPKGLFDRIGCVGMECELRRPVGSGVSSENEK